MRKYGLRILVGLITFVIGVSAVSWILIQTIDCDFISPKTEQNEVLSQIYPTIPNGSIEVRFIGFGKIEKRPTLKFEIKNNFSFPVNYRAGEEGKPDILLKFNGKEIDKETGLICFYKRDFTLGEKGSLNLEVFADELISKQLKEKGQFEFGFGYHLFNNSEQNILNFGIYDREIWTEPIVISEEVRKNILKNVPEENINVEKPQILSPKQLKVYEQ